MRIGFNSDVLRHCGFNLIETIRFIKKLGANALELSFSDSDMLFSFKLNNESIRLLNSFDYLSIHAPFDPDEGDNYEDDKFVKKILAKIEKIASQLNIEGVVFHPSLIKNFDLLNNSSLPILLENMDARKNSFKKLGSITNIKNNYGFGFVLDIEHAFENDPSLKLVDTFIDVMGNQIGEIHLSGAIGSKPLSLDGNNHCQLGKSKYREKLVGVLKRIEDIPVILEVSVQEGEEDLLKDELRYLKEVLG